MGTVHRVGLTLLAGLLASCGGGGGGGTETVACATAADDATTPIATTPEVVASTASALRVGSMQQNTARAASATSLSGLQPRPDRSVRTSSVSLGALSQARLASATALPAGNGVPRQIGLARDLVQTASLAGTAAVLDWQRTASGGQVAAISITSAEAKGLRLGVLVRSLPAQATLRVYAQDSRSAIAVPAAEVLALLQRNQAGGDNSDAARTYWTPRVDGSEATLEIELPAQVATDGVQIAIPRVSHLYSTLNPSTSAATSASASTDNIAKVGESASCEVNVACTSDYSNESNAVARMSYVGSDGGTYLCSGALVNDASASGTPYFLSANHCISKQSEASTLETFWFYRAATCSATTLNPASQTLTGGATLLYASSVTDTSFLLLANNPPAGATFAGWSAGTPALAAAVGLHHPEGDLQKISTGTVAAYQDCSVLNPSSSSFTCNSSTAASGRFLNVVYSSGVTEEGSSGSPVFQTSGGSHYLVGQLYGGNASCSNRGGSNYYGRFDVAYNAALSQWLNSAGTVPLSVSTLGNGSGTVGSSPSGISCGSTCVAPFTNGSSVVLAATPASGSSFAGWGGACSGTSTSTCTVTMDAAKSVTATFSVPAIALATALDNSLVWSTGGDMPFFSQTTTANQGGSAVQSGRIGNGQSSTLSTTVTGPGSLAFDWKVSSELRFDLLTVAVDSVVQLSWSGQGAWTRSTLDLAAGSHTITWTYAKDANRSSGQDAGWVDNVVYTATSTTPVVVAPTTPTTPVTTTCTRAAATKS